MEERERVNPPPPGNIFTQIYYFSGRKSFHASFFSYFEEYLPSFAGKLENFFVWKKNIPPKKVLFKVCPKGKRTVTREF
jgi:hypothetical protein